jgi:hypothetical protein
MFAAPIYWWRTASCHQYAKNCKLYEQVLRFRGLLLCLQHYYIGARWLLAPMYWCIIMKCVMLQYQGTLPSCLFVRTSPNNLTGEGGIWNIFFPRWRPNYKTKEHPWTRSAVFWRILHVLVSLRQSQERQTLFGQWCTNPSSSIANKGSSLLNSAVLCRSYFFIQSLSRLRVKNLDFFVVFLL